MEGWVNPGPGCKEQLAHGCYGTACGQRDSHPRHSIVVAWQSTVQKWSNVYVNLLKCFWLQKMWQCNSDLVQSSFTELWYSVAQQSYCLFSFVLCVIAQTSLYLVFNSWCHVTVFNVGFALASLYFHFYVLFCITVYHIYFLCVCVCMFMAHVAWSK